MKNILANDGLSKAGIEILEKNNFKVYTEFVPQEQLISFINTNHIAALLVRSATKVTEEVIDQCPNLKLIGRAGVGMDNIKVEYAKSKYKIVVNTPAASTNSVAELVIGHLFSLVRFLHDSNRNMPKLESGDVFKKLKKEYSNGVELRSKTLGIIGFGRIGQEIAKIAIGIGMKVIMHDPMLKKTKLELNFGNGKTVDFDFESQDFDTLLSNSDFITVNTPSVGKALIGKAEIAKMKDGAGLINASRGGIIHEESLIEALDSNKLNYAALDVFESEPLPNKKVLQNPKISLTPHIGGSTKEGQFRIGTELANLVIEHLD